MGALAIKIGDTQIVRRGVARRRPWTPTTAPQLTAGTLLLLMRQPPTPASDRVGAGDRRQRPERRRRRELLDRLAQRQGDGPVRGRRGCVTHHPPAPSPPFTTPLSPPCTTTFPHTSISSHSPLPPSRLHPPLASHRLTSSRPTNAPLCTPHARRRDHGHDRTRGDHDPRPPQGAVEGRPQGGARPLPLPLDRLDARGAAGALARRARPGRAGRVGPRRARQLCAARGARPWLKPSTGAPTASLRYAWPAACRSLFSRPVRCCAGMM